MPDLPEQERDERRSVLHDREFIVSSVVERIEETLPDKISAAVVAGFRELLQDEEAMEAACKLAFDQFSLHADTRMKLWIGGRMLTLLVGAAFAAAIAWVSMRGGK